MIARRTLVAQAAAAAVLSFGGSLALGGSPALAAGVATANAKLHDRLRALEIGSWQHIKDKDVAAMRAFLGEDAVLIFADASRYDRASFLKIIPDFSLPSFAVEGSELLMIAPDVATLLYRATYTSAVKNDKPTTVKAVASSTYARRKRKWVSVFYQETPTA